MKKGLKIFLIILLIVLLLVIGGGGAAAFYWDRNAAPLNETAFGVTAYAAQRTSDWYEDGLTAYEGVFLPGTSINGEDVSGMTPEEFKEKTEKELTEGKITLNGRNGASESIDLAGIVHSFKYEKDPATLIDPEKLARWPEAIHETQELSDNVTVVFDPAKVRDAVNALTMVTDENAEDPQDAFFTKTENGFEIIPETQGTRLEPEKVVDTVYAALTAGENTVDLEAADCYKKAAVLQDDPALTALYDQAEAMKSLVVTIDLTAAKETIDYSVFGPWMGWDGQQFTFDEEALAAYVEELSKKYWTYQTQRNFVTHDGRTIQVGGSERDTYGFWMNKDDTGIRIKNAILSGESQEIAAKWRVNALTRNQDNGDIGSTYVEISIADQHMWFFKDHNLVFESDVVTGKNSDPNRRTPTGVFCILSKLPDHTMTGSYGSQFCHYFMAFDWTGCAIHDASWRSSFGGNIYQDSGSHGCVNTPPDKMRELWGMIYTATPVIIY